MPNEHPPNDPRKLWQNRPGEPLRMSADLIRGKAQCRYQQSLFQARMSIVLGLILCVVFAWSAATARELVTRVGWAVLSLWCAYFGYHARRWFWPEQLGADAPAGPSLEFYRRELEKRSDYSRHAWRRSGLIFCFVGVALILGPPLIRSPRVAPKAAPFLVLLTGWLVAYFYLRARGRRELQQEIEQLRAFERQSR
jgi:hypothetical protein